MITNTAQDLMEKHSTAIRTTAAFSGLPLESVMSTIQKRVYATGSKSLNL